MNSTCDSWWISTYTTILENWLALPIRISKLQQHVNGITRRRTKTTIKLQSPINGVVDYQPSICIHGSLRKRRCSVRSFLRQSLRLFRSPLRRIPQVDTHFFHDLWKNYISWKKVCYQCQGRGSNTWYFMI